MEQELYALKKGGPKRLKFTFEGTYRNLKIYLDDKEIGQYSSSRDLFKSQEFLLEDDSLLVIRFIDNVTPIIKYRGKNDLEPLPRERPFANPRPIWQFIILDIISLGIYELYWLYKNWKFIMEYQERKISPIWRTVFAFLFSFSLYNEIYSLAEEKGYRRKVSPILPAFGYFILSLIWRFSLIPLGFIPLIHAVKVFDYYWSKEQTGLEKKKSFSKGEYIFMSIFLAIYILAAISSR
jgi:hypothetical protein